MTMTREQESVGQMVESLNDFIPSLDKTMPDEQERTWAKSALYEHRRNLIHLGAAIGDMRLPIGLTKDQREGLAFLLKLASEVTSDTVEGLALDAAREALTPLLEAEPTPSLQLQGFGPALRRIHQVLQDNFVSATTPLLTSDVDLIAQLIERAPESVHQLRLVFGGKAGE